MAHIRILLRNAIQTSLVAALTSAAQVFVNRADPLQDAELPAVLIMVSEEKIERVTQDHPAMLHRQMAVQIDILAKLAAGFDDTLEGIAVIIETALAASPPFAGLEVKDLVLSTATKSKPNGEGQDDLIALRLEYVALMMSRENDPQTPI